MPRRSTFATTSARASRSALFTSTVTLSAIAPPLCPRSAMFRRLGPNCNQKFRRRLSQPHGRASCGVGDRRGILAARRTEARSRHVDGPRSRSHSRHLFWTPRRSTRSPERQGQLRAAAYAAESIFATVCSLTPSCRAISLWDFRPVMCNESARSCCCLVQDSVGAEPSAGSPFDRRPVRPWAEWAPW
jgi:hypothetical protein